ncbi:hypothetical protein ACIHFD_49520 [Nonomuraea sp. NPDC051941]|uniref:hypothetical protein n=1 Tax=Nonomuraea sp. NPDC051941 TaxID=3364373 RepID=UPI0037CBB366
MSSEATERANQQRGLFEVDDPADPDVAARLITARYATGVDRELWEREGVTLPPEQAVLAVLADPAPPDEVIIASVALVPRGRQVWDWYESLALSLARNRARPISWETLGRAAGGTSKQAVQQRWERRQRDVARLEACRPEQARPRPTQRAWLDEHANHLRGLAEILLCHRRDILSATWDMRVTVALADFGTVHYLWGDADVLAGARRVVAAIREVERETADEPLLRRCVLPDAAAAALERMEALIAEAP